MHIGLVDLRWEGHHTPYVVYLSRYFTERGYRVTFLTDESNPRLDELPTNSDLSVRGLDVPKTKVDFADTLPYSVWEQIVRIRQLRHIMSAARSIQVSLVHFLYFDRTQIPLWAVTRGRSKRFLPIIATLHHDFFTGSTGSGWGKALVHEMTKRSLNATLFDSSLDCLTVHADIIRDRIIESVPAATSANTRTIPAPTPSVRSNSSHAEAREHLSLPKNEPIALFFGGLREEKGPDLLARAVEKLDRPLTVVYAGPAGTYTSADVDIWKSRIGSPVRIINRVGFVPEADLDDYFLAADVLVLPYRRRRGISGPLRRACAAGTPIIGNLQSDIGEIIETNGLGWTFDQPTTSSLRETLEVCLDELKNPPTENLQRYAADHHWEMTGKALVEIYAHVLGT